MNAIVLDGQLKSALTIVRSLGETGIFVSTGGERMTGMALHSRFTKARFTYPSPYTDQEGFVRAVRAEAIRMGGKPVVYALSDATYLSLYSAREVLKNDMVLVFPESKSIEIAFDKGATYSLARVSGVPTITTHMPVTLEEVDQLGMTLSYPAVIKPRKSVSWKNGRGVFGSAEYVHTALDLKNAFMRLKDVHDEPPLVQERITGEEYGVEMIAHAGTPVALVVHHRIRSLSPSGGASVVKEIVPSGVLYEMLVENAKKLVSALMWEGPIMVEFKVDSDSRMPLLMEINGRFWGSLPLSVMAGVNMPYIQYLLSREEKLPETCTVPKNVITSRHFWGDVRYLASVFFTHDRMRAYTYPSRRTALRAFCNLPRGTRSDVWDMHDALPALFEIIDIMNRLWK